MIARQVSVQRPLHVLIVEDSVDDAELIIRALRAASLQPIAQRVDSASAMHAALLQGPCDMVFCDHSLAGFSAVAALNLLHELRSTVPLLVVSGTIGEENAAELMRAGAADVLLKVNIGSRLALATQRELAAAQARRVAAESEQRFRDIADVSGDWMWESDPDHRFTFFAGHSLGKLSLQPAGVVGKTRWELAGGDPDGDEYWARHRADLDARRPFRGFRYSIAAPRGTIHVSVSGKPIFDEMDRFRGYRGTASDETAIIATQQALLESGRMARGIIETALDAFVQTDEAGTVLEWNLQADAMFGWPRAEAVGHALDQLIAPATPPATREEWRAQLLQVADAPVSGRRAELEVLRRCGRKMRIELAVTALRLRSGSAFNVFIRDLTEKIVAEEQLRQAQKMEAIGQLTGGVAHDFNNILTVITGTIGILAEAVAHDEELSAIARMIDEAADRGAELTRHLLAFARKQPLRPRDTDINALVVETAKLLRPTLGEHIEIEAMLEDDAWPASIDASQLTTALLNIALNARDAMPSGGKLTIETGNVVLDEAYAAGHGEVTAGPYVLIAMSDTGAGIPAAIRDKVFDPFFTTKEAGRGTGLGLSMVYGFVKQSGGHIKIYSEEDHGTSIKIYLPRAAALAAHAVEHEPAAATTGGRETILIVEDERLVRTYVDTQLRSLGYVTYMAADAAEALAVIDQGTPIDLLFTDVIMRGTMNGRQLADEVVGRRPAIKVLFTSGYTENAIVHHGRLDPGVLLLTKPYRKSDLARMIRTAIDTAVSHSDAA